MQRLGYFFRGLPGEVVNREGQSTLFAYDNLGRLTFKNAPGSEADVTYSYNLAGKPTLITDTLGHSYQYAYDAAGRQISVTDHNNRTVGYDYDKAGKLTKLDYPGTDNFALSYQYDNLNRLTGIYEGDISTGTLLAEYQHNSLSQRTLQQLNSGAANIGYQQDSRGRLTDLHYGTDPNPDYSNSDLSIGYDYDAASQITRRFYTDANYAWHNSLSQQALTTQYSAANNLNQYTSTELGNITYDDNGNLIGYNGDSYQFNSINQLTQVTTATHTVAYQYNPMGRRIQKASTPSATGVTITTDFIYSGVNNITEYENGTLKTRYIYGPGTDELVAQIHYSTSQPETETARNFYYSDGLGSIIATLGPSGTVLKSYAYSPFGLHGANNDFTDQPFGYTGQRYDSDTGLYYYKARYYHAQLGRFLSTDPIGYDDQMNLYAYVGNSPIIYRDPTGACPTCVIGAVFGFGTEATALYLEYQETGEFNALEAGGRLLVSTGVGAVTGGLGGTLVKGTTVAQKVVTTTATASYLTGGYLTNSALKGETVTGSELASDVAIDLVVDNIYGGIYGDTSSDLLSDVSQNMWSEVTANTLDSYVGDNGGQSNGTSKK